MTSATSLVQVAALGPTGPYVSRTPSPIVDVAGNPVGELSMAPVPYVTRALAQMRKAPHRDLDRASMIAEAGKRYRAQTVGGMGPDEYERTTSRITGLGISEIRSAADKIADFAANAAAWSRIGIPEDGLLDRKDKAARQGAPLWTRRGDVFAMHASGNHPAVHGAWLQALALGFRVVVRPSRREPLTAHRLVSALWESGFSQNEVVFLPTDYAAADEILRRADLAMVFGGDDVQQKYHGLQVMANGPGRSKIIVGRDVDWHDQIDLIVDSASRGGGAGCVNATAVFVDGHVAELAEAVARRLAEMPSLPPEDPDAVLPVRPLATARKTAEYVRSVSEGAVRVLGDDLVDDLGDGSAVQRPSVHILPSATDWRATIELPFPCLWFVPWSSTDDIAPLRETLNLTAVGVPPSLIDKLVAEPTIGNVFVGSVPTYFADPRLPHDGYLSTFLMKPKGFVDHSRSK